ncbi:MAG: beta-ketoacyl synthase N-terminal-like domain-containing protein, partial [Opitutales bacterium]|nr:beta-ketoacyl synthase N-terminal-like domain-containing protein [Opitutales bacterium]
MQSAITGIGIISPIGNNCNDVLKSLRGLKDGIGKVTKFCTQGMQSDMGGQVKGFNAASFMTESELAEFADPFIRLAICSAKSALQDANISKLGIVCAVLMASCNAGMTSGEREYLQMFGKSEKPFTKNDLEQYEYCALPRAMAKSLNTRCPMWMINTACSGATAALAFAQLLVKCGKFKRVLAGG